MRHLSRIFLRLVSAVLILSPVSRLTRAVWQRLISLPHTSSSFTNQARMYSYSLITRPILELNFCSIYKPKSNLMNNKIHILYKQFHLSSIRGFCDQRGEQRYTTPKINTKKAHNYAQKYLQPQNEITPRERRIRLYTSEERHALPMHVSISQLSTRIVDSSFHESAQLSVNDDARANLPSRALRYQQCIAGARRKLPSTSERSYKLTRTSPTEFEGHRDRDTQLLKSKHTDTNVSVTSVSGSHALLT
jgi:hypothetical protein